MTLYELVLSEITAKQAGQLYGLKFSRGGRAFCPWHDDGKHPALAFFDDDKKCYCFVCHNGGNAIWLTSQILGVSYYEAAQQLRQDFNLSGYTEYSPRGGNVAKPKTVNRKRDLKSEFTKRWGYLSEVVQEADSALRNYTPDNIDDRFTIMLGAMAQANDELNYMWEAGS